MWDGRMEGRRLLPYPPPPFRRGIKKKCLYTNIPHEDRIQASKYFLNAYGNCRRLSDNDIAELMKVVLENNYFSFDGDFFLQKMGTAMGSSMAPSYISLFMGKCEQDFLNTQALQPTLWLRFLYDIFFIWDHNHSMNSNLSLKK